MMPDPTDHAVELFNQAMESRAQGDLERAESLGAQAIEIFQAALGAEHPQTQMARENLKEVAGST